MPKTRPPYSPEFRRQMVELFRAGRDPDDLAREFEPTGQSIRNWIMQADRQEGRREEKTEALSPAERDELARLRRENKQLRLERDILSRAAAPAFAGAGSGSRGLELRSRSREQFRPGLRIHDREPGRFPDRDDGARVPCVGNRLLCFAETPGV